MYRVIKQDTESPKRFEKNNGKKLTVPDQAQGLNEMLARFRRGEVPMKKSVYNNDAELPDLRKMDLVDVSELKNSISKKITDEKKEQSRIKRQHEIQKRTEHSKNNPTDPPIGAV
jgi:hypothetical protein